jgi:CheY-like chemotaxis protein
MIMVVEDEQPIRDLMERVLRAHGHSVIGVASGDEALAAAEFHPVIHLLITDVVMRGMNGRELAERLQRSRPELRVLQHLLLEAFDHAIVKRIPILTNGLDTRRVINMRDCGNGRAQGQQFIQSKFLIL